MLDYLQNTKSNIRTAHIAATQPKKGKNKGKDEEKKEITTCVLFVNTKFPDFQKRVLEILLAQ